MDIIVTTPKSRMKQAAQEAENCIAQEGGYYFRNLGKRPPKNLEMGDRVFYVENGAIRGFCIAHALATQDGQRCDTTQKEYTQGVYLWMDADSWKWISPIPMQGFQGWRYSKLEEKQIHIIGDWLDTYPDAKNILNTMIKR